MSAASKLAKALTKTYNKIQEYGATATFKNITSKTHNEITGEVVTVTSDITIKVSPPDKYDIMLVNGDSVRADDCYVIVPAKDLTVTLKLGMQVEIASKLWGVVNISPIGMIDSIVAYQLQLRR